MMLLNVAAVIAGIVTFFSCAGSLLSSRRSESLYFSVAIWMHDGFWVKAFFVILPAYSVLAGAFYYFWNARIEVSSSKEREGAEIEGAIIGVASLLVLVLLVLGATSGYMYGYTFRIWGDQRPNFIAAFFSWLTIIPYEIGSVFVMPIAVGAAVLSLKTFIIGYIALTTSHPAVPVVMRSVQRRRPTAEVLHALARIMAERELDDARFAALVEQLPPWRQWAWTIRYRKMRRNLLRTRGAVEAQTGVIEEEIRLAEGVGNLERRKAARERRYGHGR